MGGDSTYPFDDLHSRTSTFLLGILRPFEWIPGDTICEIAIGSAPERSAAEDKLIGTDTQ